LSAWSLAGVLLYAAVPKLTDPPGFAQNLHAYDLLPTALLAPAALVLPWLELWVGLGLLLRRTRHSAALLSLGLMLVFLGALGSNLAKGNAMDCGCFGTSSPKTRDERLFAMKLAMLRNGVLALLALHLLTASRRDKS
jgi:hypothetical protein